MISGIYEISNLVNGKRYIGSAWILNKRWIAHRAALRKGKHCNKHLQNSWNKHGESCFQFRTLLYCDKRDLQMFEQRAIDGLKPEYNLARIAGSTRGIKYSDEARAKISAAMIGNKRTLGLKRSEESKAHLIGNKHYLGMVWTPERRAKLSQSQKGRTHRKGWKHTPEMCALKSERLLKFNANKKLKKLDGGVVASSGN